MDRSSSTSPRPRVISIPELASPVSAFPFLRSSRRHRSLRVSIFSQPASLGMARKEKSELRARDSLAISSGSRDHRIPRNNTKILPGPFYVRVSWFRCDRRWLHTYARVYARIRTRERAHRVCLSHVNARVFTKLPVWINVYVRFPVGQKRFTGVVLCFLAALPSNAR